MSANGTLVQRGAARLLRVPSLLVASLAVLVIGWPSPVAAGLAPTGTGLGTLPGSWGTVHLPDVVLSDPAQPYPPFLLGSSFAVDAGGNVYTPPCDSSFTSLTGYGNCTASTPTGGIERYSPASGTSTILDGGHNFQSMQAIAASATGTVYVIGQSGSIYAISPAGSESLISNGSVSNGDCGVAPIAITVDPTGNVFITDYNANYCSNQGSGTPASFYSVDEYVGGSWTTITQTSAIALDNLAVASNGDVYVTGRDLNTDVWGVYQVVPSGTISVVSGLTAAGGRAPESVAVDSAGNLYVVEEGDSFQGGTSSAIIETTPSGSQYLLPTSPSLASYGWSEPDELYFAGSTLYLWDEYPYQDLQPAYQPSLLYTWGSSAPNAPVATSVSSVARVDSVYQQSITATWLGTGATSYRCTLMYGFTSPSNFTVTTPSTSCTFTNLALGQSYGISVVAINGTSVSRPSITFATPAKFTITCVRLGHVRHVTGTDPRCPGGWHQR